MTRTIVLQSHTEPLPHAWLGACLESVQRWCAANELDYLWLGDELFDSVSDAFLTKTRHERVIATDLARLKAMQSLLGASCDVVVWCDADFLIFDPDSFVLPEEPYALGREVWIQPHPSDPGKLVSRIKVHNAFLMFCAGNSFLDFYVDTAERLVEAMSGPMPPQFIGPKLLTAIHNVIRCPVLETAAMLSPPVITEIATHPGPALELFRRRSPREPAAANLCGSLFARGDMTAPVMTACVERLLERRSL